MNESDAFLFGGGGQSFAFEQPGDSVTGTIRLTEVRQSTDMQTGKPATWDNGDPKMMLVVELQTALRDPAIPNDDGVRAVFIAGSKKAGTQSSHDAVASAVKAAGANSLEIGGTLTLTMIGSVPSQTRGFRDRRLYSATYVPPAAQAASEFLGTTAAPAQQAPAQVAQPAAAAVAAPATPQHSPETLAALKAAGIDPATVPVQV